MRGDNSTVPAVCSFKNQCGQCPLCARRRYKALRRTAPSKDLCEVPSCEVGKVTDDCCYRHSVQQPWNRPDIITNDGIIDWVAIDVAARGLRDVRLTWVEKDIAAGVMLAKGYGVHEAQERLGVRISGVTNSRRRLAAEKIAAAGVLEKLDRELRCLGAR